MMRMQMNLSNSVNVRQQRGIPFRGRNIQGRSMLNTNMLREIINTKPTGGCASCGSSKKVGR